MPLAEAEIRPRKAAFHLKSAEAILADVRTALGSESPRAPAGRAAVLKVMRQTLAEARRTAEQELVETGKGTRCAT
ncbi:MAG TPA: hypothetical protein PK286_12045, partial [Devosia sp.]|nr:hypothetical protein [Devosia sp.]